MNKPLLLLFCAVGSFGIALFVIYVVWPNPKCPVCRKRINRPYLRHDAAHRHECLNCGKIWS